MSLHRQFSLDRSVAYVAHARLAKDDQNRNAVVDVSSDFQWLFQEFDVKWKNKTGVNKHSKNAELGSESNKATILGAFAQPIANANIKKKGHSLTEVKKANLGPDDFGSKDHVKLANTQELLNSLVGAGFEEALEENVEL